jgi:hypothetical protein
VLLRHGWGLLGYLPALDLLKKLIVAAEGIRQSDVPGWRGNASAKLLATVGKPSFAASFGSLAPWT